MSGDTTNHRLNGQDRTPRNPNAAGRPRGSKCPSPESRIRRARLQAGYRAKFDKRNKRVFVYVPLEQVSWLADYALAHKLRGLSATIRHLIERAMHE